MTEDQTTTSAELPSGRRWFACLELTMATRRGFTLLEMLIALALTGVLVALAHGIVASVLDAAARGAVLSAEQDRDANRRFWLMRAFANVAVGPLPGRGFAGVHDTDRGHESDRIAFFTGVQGDSAVAERCVRIWRDRGGRLLAEVRLPPGPRDMVPDTVVLREDLSALGVDYLSDYGADNPWVREWISPVSAPVAVRLRLLRRDGNADTLLFHIGTRG